MADIPPHQRWPTTYPNELQQLSRPGRHEDPIMDLHYQLEMMRREMQWTQREHQGQFQRLYAEISSLRQANAKALEAITTERESRISMEKKYLAGIAGLLAIAVFRTVWEATLK